MARKILFGSKREANFWIYIDFNIFIQFIQSMVRVFDNEKVLKGQLILKANCQVVNFSKEQTYQFVFTTMRHVFVCFLEEIEDSK